MEVVNNMNKKIVAILFLLSFGTLPVALSGIERSTWRYSEEASELTGSADKSMECQLIPEGTNVSLSCLSLWGPGASVETSASVTSQQITIETAPNGGTITTLRFPFADSYENAGTGEMVINGNTATLTLTVTTPNPDTVIGTRGSRQYNRIRFVLERTEN